MRDASHEVGVCQPPSITACDRPLDELVFQRAAASQERREVDGFSETAHPIFLDASQERQQRVVQSATRDEIVTLAMNFELSFWIGTETDPQWEMACEPLVATSDVKIARGHREIQRQVTKRLNAALSEVDWREIAQEFIDAAVPPPSDRPGLFPLGLLLATPGAIEKLATEDRIDALTRHARGDWGDTGAEDRAENELSLKEGFRLFSVYHSKSGVKFWIITEADRSVTTVMVPDEY